MKLLFYIGSLRGGGAERVVSLLCNTLLRKGYDVYLAVDINHPFAYVINERIHIKDLSIRRICKGINRIKQYKHIRNIAKEVSPDIIITSVWPLNIKVLLATMGLHIPVIASEHSSFWGKKSFYEYFSRLYIQALAEKVTILTLSDFVYLDRRLPNKIVIHNPLSYPIYEEDNKRKKNILCIGGIDRWYIKGFDNIIKVWGKVSPLFPDWNFDIAGSVLKNSFDYLKQIAEDNNVLSKVNFLGFKDNIDKLMQESSVFCLSSRYEGFSMALIEAMSQGCACVSFDCKYGPHEIINNDKGGILVQDQNLEAMEKTLIRVLNDEKLRKQLSIDGKEEAKRFEADIIISKWEELFVAILEKKKEEIKMNRLDNSFKLNNKPI